MKDRTREEKTDYNFQQLSERASHYYLYVPVQYGNLSREQRKVKYLESVYIQEDGIGKTEYKLLQIDEPSVGAGRRLIWRCWKVGADGEDDIYEFEFWRYTSQEWNTLKYKEAQRPKIPTGGE